MVIPDTRFTILESLKTFIEDFCRNEVEGQSIVSVLSLTGYSAVLITAFLWLQDNALGINKSSHYKEAFDPSITGDIESLLYDLEVPKGVALLLNEHRSTDLYHLIGLRFQSTLGCYAFEYDGGRIIPPAVFFHAHNALAYQDIRKPTQHVLEQPILEIGNSTYGVSGFTTIIENQYVERNELIENIIDITNLIVRKFNTGSRASYSKIHQSAYRCESFTDVNPYLFLMNMWDGQLEETRRMLLTISDFLKSQNSFETCGTLRSIMDSDVAETNTKHIVCPIFRPTAVLHTILGSTESDRTLHDGPVNKLSFIRNISHVDTLQDKIPTLSSLILEQPSVYPEHRDHQNFNSKLIYYDGSLVSTESSYNTTPFGGKIIANGDVYGVVMPHTTRAESQFTILNNYQSCFIPLNATYALFVLQDGDEPFYYRPTSYSSDSLRDASHVILQQPNLVFYGPEIPNDLAKNNIFKVSTKTPVPVTNIIRDGNASKKAVIWSSYRCRESKRSRPDNIHVLTTMRPILGLLSKQAYSNQNQIIL